MSDHAPAPELVTAHPEQISGYTYGTDQAATSPLSLPDLERLRQVAWQVQVLDLVVIFVQEPLEGVHDTLGYLRRSFCNPPADAVQFLAAGRARWIGALRRASGAISLSSPRASKPVFTLTMVAAPSARGANRVPVMGLSAPRKPLLAVGWESPPNKTGFRAGSISGSGAGLAPSAGRG